MKDKDKHNDHYYSSLTKTAKPLEQRIFKYKNPALNFFCPLCRTERALLYRSRLGVKHYLQILSFSLLIILVTYPVFRERVFICPFFIWIGAEWAMKILFRRQLPCPHCGFDATWYKRNIKIARKRVDEFWQKKQTAVQ